MNKISIPATNSFCPQCLYLYGTYKEDNKPNYGLFCWATYCHNDGFKFVACIGEDKLTRERIRANGMFSASIVSEAMLPYADFMGCHSGASVDKSKLFASEKGAALNVPVPVDSPWTLELEVDKTIKLEGVDESEIYICNIRNVRADERLVKGEYSLEQRLAIAAPIITINQNYLPLAPKSLGAWGELFTKITE